MVGTIRYGITAGLQFAKSLDGYNKIPVNSKQNPSVTPGGILIVSLNYIITGSRSTIKKGASR